MDLATWLTAAGTFLAVVVALFKEDIVKIWRRPALAVRVMLRAPDCEKMEVQIAASPQIQFSGSRDDAGGNVTVIGNVVPGAPLWHGPMFFFRIWVENLGEQRAERVQLFASKLSLRHADGVFRPVETFLPMNLRWSNSQANAPQIFADINPAMGRHCDLGTISDPANSTLAPLHGVENGQVSFDLALEVFSNSQGHRLAPGAYRLELKIGAANAYPVSRTIEINFSGRWYPEVSDMFKNGVGIKEL